MTRFATTTILLVALALVQTTEAQTLDATFGNDGYASLSRIAFPLLLTDVETDSKDRVIVSYTDGTASGASAILLRLQPDGTLDAGFGTDGLVRILSEGPRETVRRVAVQPDESIVGAGEARELLTGSSRESAFLFRVSEDGDTQETWTYRLGTGALASDVAVLNGGAFYALSVTIRDGGPAQCGVLVVRSNGARFAGFGDNGLALLPFSEGCSTSGIEASGDGIALSGTRTEADDDDVFIARFRADGSLDPTVGTGGIDIRGFADADENATDLTTGPDGDVLLTGTSNKAGTFGLVYLRLNADGSPDEFGDNGFVFASNPNTSTPIVRDNERVGPSSGIDSSGRVTTATLTSNPLLLTLARFLPSGNLDVGFGETGFARLNNPQIENGFATGRALAFDSQNRAVFAGNYTTPSNGYKNLVGRLAADGSITSAETRPAVSPLSVSPNPARGQVSITPEAHGVARLHDALGREVFAAEVAGGRRLSIPTAALAPGVYTVTVVSEAGRQSARLTVVR